MERFYGRTHAVGLSNERALEYLCQWRDLAVTRADNERSYALVTWLDERIERRAPGFRAFRVSPAPTPLSSQDTLELFGEILVHYIACEIRAPGPRTFEWYERVAHHLDILDFVNEARIGSPILAPELMTADPAELKLHRMWAQFEDARWRQERLAMDDPRYPDTEHMLAYLDQMLEIVAQDGREAERSWPFPKILWEREILLERLGRYDEMAATMRRAAKLEDEAFRRQTEEYIAVVKK